MALHEVKCIICGDILMRDDWDGQYYQQDRYGLWNKMEPVEIVDDGVVCSQECYETGDYKISDEERNNYLADLYYQEYKDGER